MTIPDPFNTRRRCIMSIFRPRLLNWTMTGQGFVLAGSLCATSMSLSFNWRPSFCMTRSKTFAVQFSPASSPSPNMRTFFFLLYCSFAIECPCTSCSFCSSSVILMVLFESYVFTCFSYSFSSSFLVCNLLKLPSSNCTVVTSSARSSPTTVPSFDISTRSNAPIRTMSSSVEAGVPSVALSAFDERLTSGEWPLAWSCSYLAMRKTCSSPTLLLTCRRVDRVDLYIIYRARSLY